MLAENGWTLEIPATAADVEPGHSRRERPFAYRLHHPKADRPLLVVGHYQSTSV